MHLGTFSNKSQHCNVVYGLYSTHHVSGATTDWLNLYDTSWVKKEKKEKEKMLCDGCWERWNLLGYHHCCNWLKLKKKKCVHLLLQINIDPSKNTPQQKKLD